MFVVRSRQASGEHTLAADQLYLSFADKWRQQSGRPLPPTPASPMTGLSLRSSTGWPSSTRAIAECRREPHTQRPRPPAKGDPAATPSPPATWMWLRHRLPSRMSANRWMDRVWKTISPTLSFAFSTPAYRTLLTHPSKRLRCTRGHVGSSVPIRLCRSIFFGAQSRSSHASRDAEGNKYFHPMRGGMAQPVFASCRRCRSPGTPRLRERFTRSTNQWTPPRRPLLVSSSRAPRN